MPKTSHITSTNVCSQRSNCGRKETVLMENIKTAVCNSCDFQVEEEERQKNLTFGKNKSECNYKLQADVQDAVPVPDLVSGTRDAATEAVGSILAGLGSNIMDTDTLNQTFAELGKLVVLLM